MNDNTEFEQIERFMQNRDIARAKDLREFGISGTAISRATAEGILIKDIRGSCYISIPYAGKNFGRRVS